MSFDPLKSHLTSWREVREHLNDASRWSRYRRLMEDYGIDPEIASEGERRKPRFLFAEHPGNWAYPADILRVRLAVALAERCGTEADIMQFENDVFRKNGIKRFFTQWCLHPLLPWVSLARAKADHPRHGKNGSNGHGSNVHGSNVHGSNVHGSNGGQNGSNGQAASNGQSQNRIHRSNAWHRQVYGSIHLQGLNRQTLTDKLDTALELIRCVAGGELPLALLNSSCSRSAREILGGPWNRKAAVQLAKSMTDSDLLAAQGPLLEGLQALQGPITWAELWRRVNSTLLGRPVQRVDPVLEGFLLAIRDPYKMARRLSALDGAPKIPVAAFVDDGEFRLVIYEAQRDRFIALRSTGDQDGQEISWDLVRQHARAGLGGTPSATIEYLMLAANGFFIVCDPFDGHTPFEQRVAKLHHEAIGRPFPWTSLSHRFVTGHSGSYLDCYRSEFETFCQQHIDDDFFREGSP